MTDIRAQCPIHGLRRKIGLADPFKNGLGPHQTGISICRPACCPLYTNLLLFEVFSFPSSSRRRSASRPLSYEVEERAAIQEDGRAPKENGGAAANDFLMQFQADILAKPVVRPANIETTALGAAFLAGLATQVWSGTEEIERFWKAEHRFEPQMDASRREELFEGWKRAVAACCR